MVEVFSTKSVDMEIDVFTWIDANENIDKVIASSIAFLKYKQNGLLSKSPQSDMNTFVSRTIALETLFMQPLPTVETILPGDFARSCSASASYKASDETTKSYAENKQKLIRFRQSVTVIEARVKHLCDTLARNNGIEALRSEFRTNIKNAILNLRTRISGTTGSVPKIRGRIERMLYDFANSWESFKDSYNMNMVLLGGAGVGKTTMADAFSECLYAFGILAGKNITKPEKPDLIGQYLGQTAPLVYNQLYGSLEGVCFIDEAYSIAGSPGGGGADYGQEFIDALVEFTQKFPGYLCLIVAGYKKEMQENFFSRNEGLYRRFPTVFELLPYPLTDIKRAFINRVIAKRELNGKDPAIVTEVTNALFFHTMLLQLMYFDTGAADDDSYYPAGFFDKYTFNLSPILTVLYLSPSEEKRNILKAYIMRYVLGIKEGDLFPNQMGDVQNYVDKTLKVENVFLGKPVTLLDAQKSLNAYFSIRSNHKLYLMEREEGKTAIEFVSNGLNPSDFGESVLYGFLKPIITFGGTELNLNERIGDRAACRHVEQTMGEIYTKAITAIHQDFLSNDPVKRPPSYVQSEFLKFEAETLERMNRERVAKGEVGRSRLKYFESIESMEEDTDLSESGGSLPIKRKITPQEACGGLVRMESGAHRDGLVAAPVSPGSGAAAAAAAPSDVTELFFKKQVKDNRFLNPPREISYIDQHGGIWSFLYDPKNKDVRLVPEVFGLYKKYKKIKGHFPGGIELDFPVKKNDSFWYDNKKPLTITLDAGFENLDETHINPLAYSVIDGLFKVTYAANAPPPAVPAVPAPAVPAVPAPAVPAVPAPAVPAVPAPGAAAPAAAAAGPRDKISKLKLTKKVEGSKVTYLDENGFEWVLMVYKGELELSSAHKDKRPSKWYTSVTVIVGNGDYQVVIFMFNRHSSYVASASLYALHDDSKPLEDQTYAHVRDGLTDSGLFKIVTEKDAVWPPPKSAAPPAAAAAAAAPAKAEPPSDVKELRLTKRIITLPSDGFTDPRSLNYMDETGKLWWFGYDSFDKIYHLHPKEGKVDYTKIRAYMPGGLEMDFEYNNYKGLFIYNNAKQFDRIINNDVEDPNSIHYKDNLSLRFFKIVVKPDVAPAPPKEKTVKKHSATATNDPNIFKVKDRHWSLTYDSGTLLFKPVDPGVRSHGDTIIVKFKSEAPGFTNQDKELTFNKRPRGTVYTTTLGFTAEATENTEDKTRMYAAVERAAAAAGETEYKIITITQAGGYNKFARTRKQKHSNSN